MEIRIGYDGDQPERWRVWFDDVYLSFPTYRHAVDALRTAVRMLEQHEMRLTFGLREPCVVDMREAAPVAPKTAWR